jgi:hypothetical protein
MSCDDLTYLFFDYIDVNMPQDFIQGNDTNKDHLKEIL